MSNRFFLAAVTLICFAPVLGGPATAQQGALEIQNEPNYVAAAIAYVPDYIGSDDYTMAAGLAGRWTFSRNREIKLAATTLSSNLIDHEFFRLGPVINYRFGRDSVDDQRVSLMTDIEGTIEIGATAGLEFKNDVNPRYRFGVTAEFLHDVGDEHEGFTLRGGMHYWTPLGMAFDFGIRGDLTYGDSSYMNTYFGVSAANSSRSGLTRFTAGGGLRDVSVTPVLLFHISEKWHVGGFMRYQRILSDAADSPIVDVRGDADQYLIGLGAAYSW